MKASVKIIHDQNGAISLLIAAIVEEDESPKVAALVQRERLPFGRIKSSMSQQDCKQTDNSRFRR